MNLKDFWGVLKQSAQEFSEDKAPRLAAALAYYTVFSLAPFLILVITITGAIIGRSDARNTIMSQVESLAGPTGAEAVSTLIEGAVRPGQGILTSVISIAVLIFAATGLFNHIHEALNTVWEVQPKQRSIWGTIKERFFSFAVVLVVAFMLLVSLVISALLSVLDQYLAGLFPGAGLILVALNLAISFLVITLLFALIYKYLPEATVKWGDVWPGAAVTALLFVIGKELISLYLGTSGVASSYGAFGSLIVMLLWVYYSSMILFFGAEFTQVYARRFGAGLQLEEGARLISEQERRQAGIPHADSPRPASPALSEQAAMRMARGSMEESPPLLERVQQPRTPPEKGMLAFSGLILALLSYLGISMVTKK